MIANVDVTIIVTSVKEPDLSLLLLDKLLCLVLFNKIKPIICFSKTDLINDEEYNKNQPPLTTSHGARRH